LACKRWLLLPVFSLTLALAIGFAACGGDDDDTAGRDTTRTANPGATAGGNGDDDDRPTESADAGGDDSSANLGFGVCSLLTESEVSDALAADASEGEEFAYDPFFDCRWQTDNFDSVTVTVAERDVGESLYNFSNDEAEEVDGVGDEAQYYSQLLSSLEVLEGDHYFSVSVSASELDDGQLKAVSIDLARKILGRLP
jgi:hypothetical protein